MTPMWKIFHSGKKVASENMKLDEELLKKMKPSDPPMLHLYGWSSPSATYGYFIEPEKLLKKDSGLTLSRRPTGGGVLFHLWDLAFSVFIPSRHPGYSDDVMKNYKYVNDAVLLAVKGFLKNASPVDLLPVDPVALDSYCEHFCFAKPTKYDVMIGGKKVAGAAQRKKQNGFLHQGSISLALPKFDFLESILPLGSRVVDAMKIHTFAPLPSSATEEEIEDARRELSSHLQKTITGI